MGCSQSKAPVRQEPIKGIIQERSCTDVLCLLLLFALWIAMTVVGSIASTGADYNRLLGPINSEGKVCGYDAGYISTRYFYTVTTSGIGSCVDSCYSTDASLSSISPSDYVCLDSINNQFPNDIALSAYIAGFCMSSGQYDISTDCGCNIIRSTYDSFNRCRFTDSTVRSEYTTQGSMDYFQTFISDVMTAREVLFGFGFVIALALSFFMTFLLRWKWLGYLTVWSCMLIVLCVAVEFIIFCQSVANDWAAQSPRQHSGDSISALRIFSIIMMAAVFIYVCFMIAMRKAINIAVRTISLAARAIDDMPAIVFTPLIQVTGFVLFFLPFIFYCFFLASDGYFKDIYYTYTDPILHTTTSILIGKSYHLSPGVSQRLWFMFFCLLWTMNFIAAIGSMVISMSCANWYFSDPQTRSKKFTSLQVIKSYGIVLRYHLGTLAFGSLILALIEFPKFVLLYIKKYYFSGTSPHNKLMQYVLGCAICILELFDRCIRFINKNAYIQTSIHGRSFIFAAKDAFMLIARNVFTVGAVELVSTLALTFMKVFVCFIVTACAYFFFSNYYANSLHDFVAPSVLVMIISWMTASMFSDVFHTCIDTIIMCYLTDLEDNGEPVYADDKLKAFIEKHGKLSEEEAKKLGKTQEIAVAANNQPAPL